MLKNNLTHTVCKELYRKGAKLSFFYMGHGTWDMCSSDLDMALGTCDWLPRWGAFFFSSGGFASV